MQRIVDVFGAASILACTDGDLSICRRGYAVRIPPPFALASNLDKVYGWNISLDDDKPHVARVKGL